MKDLGVGLLLILLSLGASGANSRDEGVETPASRPTIGLVLSGGGARGAAHVGVIRVLDQLRIPVDFIAGTSMGAVVGGLYAAGISAGDLEEIFETADWALLLSDRPPRAKRSYRRKSDDAGFLVNLDFGLDKNGLIFPAGFIQGQNLEMALRRLAVSAISVEDFDQLPIPFRAVATDIVNGQQVILRSGDLATAMRASMSAPGVFKPVRIDGRMLVDGGVVNNLPVEVVRDMGADVLIVVDVGFPLLPADELGSAIAVTSQMLTILINARARDQAALLSDRDIFIAPELGDFGSQQFEQASIALHLGAEKAGAMADRLRQYSLSAPAYAAYRHGLEQQVHSSPFTRRVIVKNESALSPQVIAARLSDQGGNALDLQALESEIADIYGFDTFERVTYDIVDEDTLSVQAIEKSWGPNYVRFGINLEDNFKGESSYNLAARLTRTEINPKGGEIRAELQIGESPRFFAELYQPLDYSGRWFLNPQIESQRENTGLFDDGRQLARLQADASTVSLQAGRQFGNWGEFRLGLTRGRADSEVSIGLPAPDDGSVDFTNLAASFGYDTIDRVAIPRSGANVAASWISSRQSLSSDIGFDAAQLFVLYPRSKGKNTLLHWWNLGGTTRDNTPGAEPFSLGGLFNLSGYAPAELAGKHLTIGRLLYYRRLGDQSLPVLNSPVYLGVSLEAGNVWNKSTDISFDDTLFAGSVFMVFDSIVGPLYLAYGAAEGGRESAYLFLGQTF